MVCGISVVVPSYNVEQYLKRALDSLLAQTYVNWEAILVDDGSLDSCGSIADNYATTDKRFKVIHKTNGGLSDARNTGMKLASGKYLLFLDPDDFYHPQLMELCYNVAEKEDSEMVVFTHNHFYRNLHKVKHFLHLPDSQPSFKNYQDIKYITTDNIFDYATEYSHPKDIDRRWAVKHCQVCFKMYRTDLVKNIPFIVGIFFEDFPWWSEVLLHIKRCTILNLPLYYYYPNPKSFILSSNANIIADNLEKSIMAAKKVYENAPFHKKAIWEKQFLTPFLHFLERKKNTR